LHTNGYSLARRIAFDIARLGPRDIVPEIGGAVGEVLLTPHRSYLPVIRPLLSSGLIKGMAHITGGGITDNLPRIIPAGLHASIDRSSWTVPPIFRWLQQTGHVPPTDMFRTFNMGIGLIVVCAEQDVARMLELLAEAGESGAVPIGHMAAGGEGVE
jgi:phosphoribosylformylglycinamidine cyclo-ligase